MPANNLSHFMTASKQGENMKLLFSILVFTFTLAGARVSAETLMSSSQQDEVSTGLASDVDTSAAHHPRRYYYTCENAYYGWCYAYQAPVGASCFCYTSYYTGFYGMIQRYRY